MSNITSFNEQKKLNYSVREAFKSLRTNLLFCGDEYKTIVITSCVKNEGKSTISIELAKSLSLAEKKVLLIDADLRKSVYASTYTINSQAVLGLSEYLSGQADYDSIMYKTQYESLDLIFAGAVPPNPVELLSSKKFEALVRESREKYDYVIIDAAPLGAVIDAAAVASFCDGAIMVISANEIRCRMAQDVKEQLEKSDCKVLGAILNKIPLKAGSYYNNYYRKYYGKPKKGGIYGYGHYGAYGYASDDDQKDQNVVLANNTPTPTATEQENLSYEIPTAVEQTPVDKDAVLKSIKKGVKKKAARKH